MRAYSCLLTLALVVLPGCGSEPPPTVEVGAAAIEFGGPAVLSLEQGLLPVVTVLVNGQKARFLVDSGSTITVMESSAAQELGLSAYEYDSPIEGEGSSGAEITFDRYVALALWELGDIVLRDTRLTLYDGGMLQLDGVAGILGQDLLARMVVVFDMERLQLHLLPGPRPPGELAAYLGEQDLGAGDWIIQPTEFRPCPYLPFLLSASEAELLLVDTGAAATGLPRRLLDSLDLESTGTGYFAGIGGVYESALYELENWDFFGAELSLGVHESVGGTGLLGMDVLGHFVVLLDGPGEVVWMHKR